jgi:hypothetical protein
MQGNVISSSIRYISQFTCWKMEFEADEKTLWEKAIDEPVIYNIYSMQ